MTSNFRSACDLSDAFGQALAGDNVRIQSLPASEPWLLHNPESCGVIATGYVDLFSVPLSNGEVEGPRNHLVRLFPGHVLFGISCSNVGVLAVGMRDTQILRFDRSHFASLLSHKEHSIESQSMLNSWVETLGLCLSFVHSSQPAGPSEVGQSVSFEPGEILSPCQHARWMTLEKGEWTWFGTKELPLSSERTFLVLPPQAWLRAETESQCDLIPMADFVGAGHVWSCLDTLHQSLLDALSFEHQQRQLERVEARREQVEQNQKLFGQVVESITSTWKSSSVSDSSAPPADWTLPRRKLTQRDLLRFALRSAPVPGLFLVVLSVLLGSLAVLLPWVAEFLLDQLLPSRQTQEIAKLTLFAIGFLLASGGLWYAFGLTWIRIGSLTEHRVLSAIWDRILRLPTPFFRAHHAGSIAFQSMEFRSAKQILSQALPHILLALCVVFCSAALLFSYHTSTAWFAIATGVFVALSVASLRTLRRRYDRKDRDLQALLSGQLLQFLSGIERVRASGAEVRALNQWAQTFTQQGRVMLQRGHINLALFVLRLLLLSSAYLGTLLFLAQQSKSPVTAGQFVAFSIAYGQFLVGLLYLEESWGRTREIRPILGQLQPVLQAVPESKPAALEPKELRGSIEVNHVTFRYSQSGPAALDNLSLRVEPGQFVAIVGPSGSGKSTLFRILLGFETPEMGSVYFDNYDVSLLDMERLRQNLGVVLQHSQLLPGDILGNIAGTSSLQLQEAWNVARMVGLEQDIRAMPMQMHTVLSQGGTNLSGGQRQRLLIARALARKPRILLFDEATSTLDNQAQALVSENLASLRITRVVIAHRLSTIVKADRIYVFDQGKIVQEGTFTELLQQPGLFAQMAQRQQ